MASCWTDCVIQQAIVKSALASVRYVSVHEVEAKAVSSIIASKDVFISLPTETGKSLCFALVPLVFDHLFGYKKGTETSIVIVVFPLIALIKDQVCPT